MDNLLPDSVQASNNCIHCQWSNPQDADRCLCCDAYLRTREKSFSANAPGNYSQRHPVNRTYQPQTEEPEPSKAPAYIMFVLCLSFVLAGGYVGYLKVFGGGKPSRNARALNTQVKATISLPLSGGEFDLDNIRLTVYNEQQMEEFLSQRGAVISNLVTRGRGEMIMRNSRIQNLKEMETHEFDKNLAAPAPKERIYGRYDRYGRYNRSVTEISHTDSSRYEELKSARESAEAQMAEKTQICEREKQAEAYFSELSTKADVMFAQGSGADRVFEFSIKMSGKHAVLIQATKKDTRKPVTFYWAKWIDANGLAQELRFDSTNQAAYSYVDMPLNFFSCDG